MRKVQYPKNRKAFERDYLKLFRTLVAKKQSDWEHLRNELIAIGGKRGRYPRRLSSVLTLSYAKLVDLYLDYERIGAKENTSVSHTLETELFNYSLKGHTYGPYQPSISEFFMKHAQELHLSVCHYCEMSYINAYGLNTMFPSFEDFLKNGSEEEIRFFVRNRNGGEYKGRTLKKIYNLRASNGDITREFNEILSSGKSDEVWGRLRNHFDLDHFLPKGECPLVGLSLYNFVPSCAVCNEKLKGKKLWGTASVDDLKKMSPTSDNYEFDSWVDVNLIPRNGTWMMHMKNRRDEVKLDFDSHGTAYSGEVEVLRLRERYNYHKDIAISLHDKLLDYPSSKIQEIADTFKGMKTAEEVRNELFESESETILMQKMKRDIKKKFLR